MKSVWVLGAGGLIGSATVDAFRAVGHSPFEHSRLAWGTDDVVDQLRGLLREFIAQSPRDWIIVWAAGASVTNSAQDQFEAEFRVLQAFVDELELSVREGARGVLLYISSAGAMYGGARHPPFSEHSAVVPAGPYGFHKLRSEHLVRDVGALAGFSTALLRVANVYGPGQNLAKRQGLISHLADSAIRRVPLQVYVPADTLRHYIYADDLGRAIVALSEVIAQSSEPVQLTKVLTSRFPMSVSQVVGAFSNLPISKPLVVFSSSADSRFQARDLRLTSVVAPEVDRYSETPFMVGLARTYENALHQLLRSRP